MKLEQVDLFESIADIDELQDITELEDAYQELEILYDAMRTGNYGLLIGKRGMLTERDILRVKRELKSIVDNNKILDGGGLKHQRDGKERLRILGKSVGHSIELLGLTAITGILGAAAVTSAVGTAGLGTAAAGAGALLTGTLAVNQAETLRHLRAASKLVAITDAYADEKSPNKSAVKGFFNRLMGKRDSESMKREAKGKIKQASRRLVSRVNKIVGKAPKDIQVRQQDGTITTVSIYELFNF